MAQKNPNSDKPPDDPRFCGCEETLLLEGRVMKPRYHSCDYIRRINERIVEACVQADRLTEAITDEGLKNAAWQSAFARQMNYARADVLKEMDAEAIRALTEEMQAA